MLLLRWRAPLLFCPVGIPSLVSRTTPTAQIPRNPRVDTDDNLYDDMIRRTRFSLFRWWIDSISCHLAWTGASASTTTMTQKVCATETDCILFAVNVIVAGFAPTAPY
ncbi:hypothetical protein MKEN_00200600 [Mycena kentingensis (nom. inval.)]|nr:hypothetical protein MKEN_00200600 [Mycena kentingensis (nom. inval.)]